jgi:E3 ubiquitin-protein ligase HUWE1
VAEHRLVDQIRPQIDAFLSGFRQVIPTSLITIFDEQELELLISGLPEIDVDDWKNNTEYQGYTLASAPIQWFWRCVRAMSLEERAKLIQFVTGTSKVPLEGFAHLQGSSGRQRFQIHRDFGAKDRLPSAHTCFNQLDLPEYDSYEALRDALKKVIGEFGTGFGLA